MVAHPTAHFSICTKLFNQHHPTLKYTHEISEDSVDFLDITIHKGKCFQETNLLDIKTFFKKTNTFQYLHYKSAHPPSTRKAVITVEATRFRRTNSNVDDTITQLKEHLQDRNYPEHLLSDTLAKVPYDHTTTLSNPKPTQKDRPLIFRTTFSDHTRTLKSCLMKHWHTISDSELSSTFPNEPILSFQKAQTHFVLGCLCTIH